MEIATAVWASIIARNPAFKFYLLIAEGTRYHLILPTATGYRHI